MPTDRNFQLLKELLYVKSIVNSYAFWLISISLFCLILERICPWHAQKLMRPLLFQDLFWLIFGFLIADNTQIVRKKSDRRIIIFSK